MVQTRASATTVTWAEANQVALRAELHRLRLLIARRVRWLRRNWREDSLGGSRGVVISDALADRLLSGEDAECERRFYREDAGSAAITGRLDALRAELDRMRRGLTPEGDPPALEVLVRRFGLSPLDRDWLLLCLAPEEDPPFSTLYAYVQDDVQARDPTIHLGLSLFCTEPGESAAARGSLLPGAPLRRFRMITVGERHSGGPRSAHPLHIDGRIADYLRGLNRPDEDVVPLLCPVPPAPVVGVHRELVDGLVRWAVSMAIDDPWPPFLLTGPTGAGKQGMARAFCDRIGLRLFAIDPARLPAHEPERHQLHHLMEREAILSHIALYLDVSDIDPADRALIAATRDWIERSGGVLFVGSRERWPIRRHAIQLAVPRLDHADQRALWWESLEGVPHSVDGQIDAIVEQFDFGPTAIPRAVASALDRVRQGPAGDAPLTAGDLWNACRAQVGWRLGDLARRLEPAACWEDIVLPDDTARQLREIADQVAARPLVYESWGFGDRLARGRGINALFSGPSGTGKTMAAEVLANHLRLDLYRIDLAGVVSKYIGETEKNLRNVFDAAEQSGAILFFDEADALFGKRTEVKDSHDRYANIEVNYLLQRMEDYRGLAILCTNRRAAIDRAFLRRLRFLVEFPFPDWAHRRLIWEKVFPPRASVGSLDLDALARLEVSGGNIRNIALNAAFLAAGERAAIGMEHVLHAARREYAKIDKLPTEGEFGAHSRIPRS